MIWAYATEKTSRSNFNWDLPIYFFKIGIDVHVLFVFFIGMIASLLSLSLTILLLTGAYYKRHTSIQSWLVIVGMILSA